MAVEMAVKMTLELAVSTRKALKVTVVKMNLHMALHLNDPYLYFHLTPENQYHTHDHFHLAAEH